MKFIDLEVSSLDLQKVDDLICLVVTFLCGEKHFSPSSQMLALVEEWKKNATKINFEQFNELLLILNQNRVGRAFFNFFFTNAKNGNTISLEELKEGVTKFRGLSMLCFGNFRFAYKHLIYKKAEEFKSSRLSGYCKDRTVSEFCNRPEKLVKTKLIERDKTWYVGETTPNTLEKEGKNLNEELIKGEDGKSDYAMDELLTYNRLFAKMTEDAEEVQKDALRNTDVYLTWGYLDIYIATSMRFRWEFEEIFDFIQEIFSSPNLKDLKLCYFDPTQSKCKNSRDKGLVEGLMLKMASFTIYLAQESDTMGKASEMAATLAQNKPVIAFVPEYSPTAYAKKINDYPLEYFWNRLPLLKCQLLKDPELADELDKNYKNYYQKIGDFLDELEDHLRKFPLSFYANQEKKFKKTSKGFKTVCELLAIAEIRNFDRRAKLLAEIHPLSMQIGLETGVANGVLVVRDSKKCSQLIRKLITNDLSFEIEHKDEGFTQLKEEISGCPFRVITDDEKLTNTFWNIFFDMC